MSASASIDAATAAAHYLQMIDPARNARAIAYTTGSHWLLLWTWLAKVGVDFALLRSGALVALEGKILQYGQRPKLAAFACVAAFVASSWLLLLPWTIYSEWWRERSYDLTTQPLLGWLGQSLIVTLFGAVFLGLLAIPFYALIRRTGSRWWAWASIIVAVFSLFAVVVAPATITPLLNTSRPVPDGPIRTAVAGLAKAADIPADRIVVVDGSKESSRYTATVVGGPGFATIELSDAMLSRNADIGEVRAVVAHEMGHYAHYHLLVLALVVAVLATAGLFVTNRLFYTAARATGSRDLRIEQPSAAPLIHMSLVTFMLITSPLIVSTQRFIEADADRYGLALANEPDGAARALLETVDFRAAAPGTLEEALFYDHPSIARRLRTAMDWKAAHGSPEGGRTPTH